MAQKPSHWVDPDEAAIYVLSAIRELAPAVRADLLRREPTKASAADWAAAHSLNSVRVAWYAWDLLRCSQPGPKPEYVMIVSDARVVPPHEVAWRERARSSLQPPDPRYLTLKQWLTTATRIYREAEEFVPKSQRVRVSRSNMREHCTWLVRARVCGESHGDIARSPKRIERPAVTMAVSRIVRLLEIRDGQDVVSLDW